MLCLYVWHTNKYSMVVFLIAWCAIGIILSVAFAKWRPPSPFPRPRRVIAYLLLDIPCKIFVGFWGVIGSIMMWGPLFSFPRGIVAVSSFLMPVPSIAMLLMLLRSKLQVS